MRIFGREINRNSKAQIIIVLAIICGLSGINHGWRYTPLGHTVRLVCGVPVATQTAEDLADEVKSMGLPMLQAWACAVMAKYMAGSLRLGGKAAARSLGNVDIEGSDIPYVVKNYWPSPPEVSIRLDKHRDKPECVVLSFGLYGALIGPPTYRFPSDPGRSMFCVRTAGPEVYTYYEFK